MDVTPLAALPLPGLPQPHWGGVPQPSAAAGSEGSYEGRCVTVEGIGVEVCGKVACLRVEGGLCEEPRARCSMD